MKSSLVEPFVGVGSRLGSQKEYSACAPTSTRPLKARCDEHQGVASSAARAVVLTILSLGTTFGVLVWVLQDGHLSSVLGFDPIGALDVTMLLIVFAFGLSMDYEVFRLARIKEAWDETGDNDPAVAI